MNSTGTKQKMHNKMYINRADSSSRSLNQYAAIMQTPFAILGLSFQQRKLVALDFLADVAEKHSTDDVVQKACWQILRYCEAGSGFKKFEIETCAAGTDFQKKVLKALRQIPYGCTQTYGTIAKKLNTSPRAVGNACRRNPIPLIIPCHRVIAAKGLGGYDGATEGALPDMKYALLRHEGALG